VSGHAETAAPPSQRAPTPVVAVRAGPAPPASGRERRYEFLYFALRNTKLLIGLSVIAVMMLAAGVGPMVARHAPFAYGGPPAQGPSSDYWFGTTQFGQDVFSQFVNGLRASFFVGALAGAIATALGMVIGFTAGYRGGLVDDVLNMLTNVVLVIPTFAVLLVIAAYSTVHGLLMEAIVIGLVSWPWAARAIRAQTFSLVSRDFVDMARLSGVGTTKIIVREIAPMMSSYLFMAFILQFGNAILTAATLDFIGLGPPGVSSLGLMMNFAVTNAALVLGIWWWFVPPGLGIMAIVGALYITNVGLDEVFNPKLRET
jgi:peptide/nickel transport system permease protein